MTDVTDLIRKDLARAEAKREANRRAFPGVAEIVDSLTAAFGPVKVLHAVENGKEIGKPQPFDGTDIDQILKLVDETEARRNAPPENEKRGKRQ